MESEVDASLREFIISNYLFGDTSRLPDDRESLIESGVIDSTGILELIEFLEERFGISVEESETVPQNLGSVANILDYIARKSKQAGLATPSSH